MNTGGMGTIAPNPYYTEEVAEICRREIFLPTVDAMNREGRPFQGCLYFGLMLTPKGPKVIEYNCRFGDPETQVVLPLLESDLLTVMMACTNGTLAETEVRFSAQSACCVILASGGYPKAYESGYPIRVDEDMTAELFVAGAKERDGEMVTAGGRVLGVTAVAGDLPSAIAEAYRNVPKIRFEKAHYRTDIGKRALEATK